MSHNWKGSDRRARLPSDWPARVAKTKHLARNQCQWILPSGKRCPRKGTDCDHIIPGDNHEQANLQLLCGHHHGLKTAKESQEGRWGKKKIVPRSEGPHPGTLN